jgi:hypothetical protein
MTLYEQKVGEVIRVEWDKVTGSVRVVIEIVDSTFKSRVLHSKDLQDLLTIKGKDAIVIASKKDDQCRED